MHKILFVCHGNICRSPMAEFVMKDIVKKAGKEDEYLINSCATSTEELGNDIHRGTKTMLTKMEIPFESREAIRLKKSDYDEYDYLIAMDKYNLENIYSMMDKDETESSEGKKIYMLSEFSGEPQDIADPWYTGNFDVTYQDVQKGCMALFDMLENNI